MLVYVIKTENGFGVDAVFLGNRVAQINLNHLEVAAYMIKGWLYTNKRSRPTFAEIASALSELKDADVGEFKGFLVSLDE